VGSAVRVVWSLLAPPVSRWWVGAGGSMKWPLIVPCVPSKIGRLQSGPDKAAPLKFSAELRRELGQILTDSNFFAIE